MPPEPDPENALSAEEASEVIAAATGTPVEEIRRGVEEIEAVPPEEAEVIADSE